MQIQRWLPLMLLLVATTTHAQAAPTDSAQVEASTEDAVPPPPAETTAPTETATPTSAPVQAEARTQPADVSVRSDEPEASGAAYQQAVEAGIGVRLELDGINHQQDAANALYVTSTILAVLGTGSVVGGVFGIISSIGGSSSGSSVGATFIVIGAALNIGHVVTMVIAACLDYGSGSHRRKFLHDHPELAFELTPGPGDAGLGLALHF